MKNSVSAVNVGKSSCSYPRMSGPSLADSSTVPAVNFVSTGFQTSVDTTMRCCTSSRDANVGMRALDHYMSMWFSTLSVAHLYTCLCFASCLAVTERTTVSLEVAVLWEPISLMVVGFVTTWRLSV